MEEDKLDTLLTVYQTLINQLAVYPNVKAYFPGYEPWIIKNPGNYEDSLLDTGEMITRSVILNTWSGKCYQITPENEVDIWTSFRRLIESEKSMPGVYPDLSKWHMVFSETVYWQIIPGVPLFRGVWQAYHIFRLTIMRLAGAVRWVDFWRHQIRF